MNVPSKDIKDMLEAETSLGLTFTTDLFVGKEPALPNNIITIFDTPGGSADLYADRTIRWERPAIQIRSRNTSYVAGWDILDDIRNVLQGRANETWNGTFYGLITAAGDIFLLDWDENNRARFVLNFNIQRGPSGG